ncbi:MAG: mitochondrial fission ELM1 family protein, partial [Pseudoxanthomonas sp.]
PWRWLAPRRLPGAAAAFGADFAAALHAPPRLAIGCGRQGALATRLARAAGARAVQILDPRLDPRHWDLLIVPAHDRLRGANVLTLLGSLNPVDEAWLAAGRTDFPALGALPGPRIALLLGGPTAQRPWRPDQLGPLCAQLAAQARARGGSLLVSASRRTPAQTRPLLQQALRELPSTRLWWDENDGRNPYRGLLGWADAIVATADSVNLLSEACATPVPVAAAFAEHARGRIGHFLEQLHERGRLRTLDTLLDHGASITPLRETTRIAALARQRLGLP